MMLLGLIIAAMLPVVLAALRADTRDLLVIEHNPSRPSGHSRMSTLDPMRGKL